MPTSVTPGALTSIVRLPLLGRAELADPIGHGGTNLASRGVGYTIVDTLDTLLIMGLTDEYARARAWVADELSFDVGGRQHAFEITIRGARMHRR